MPRRKALKTGQHINVGTFDEGILDRLVDDALDRVDRMRADMLNEGETVGTERGPVANPKMAILRDEREWIRKAWSTKFQGKADVKEKEDYFAQGPKEV